MGKIFRKLPEEHVVIVPWTGDTKKFFYIGTSDAISLARHNIYNTGTVPTLISDIEQARVLKIGISNNPDVRLQYHLEKIPDFRYLKVWKIKYAKTLESWVLGENYKAGFSTLGSEWFWGSEKQSEDLLTEIDWLIDNTFQEVSQGYRHLYK